ncbi:GAF and ANTAR domain-containing protein [Actinoplanes sp. NPDC049316]|uniref:GAF and ANTAR domain-containing protein n=1 Tax=Actinoplanes sp. NPDC049316 TaxID=3154727 RepID=UPI003447AB5B
MNDLAAQLSDMARSLQQQDGMQDTLDGIVTAAVQTVPGAGHAGVMVVKGRRHIQTPAATDEVVRRVDRAQYETRQGPCLDATYEQQTVRLPDMAEETRWPDFSRRALTEGIRSMLSFQLYVEGDNLGALNLYSGLTSAFDDESEHVGLLFASHAAVAMVGARREQDLTRAISVRDLIGQAKGILMERHKITDDRAFQLLVRVSQHANVKLVEVARNLVETGELNDPRRP